MNDVSTIAKGDGSGITTPRRVVIRDDEAWRKLSASTDRDGLGDFADTEVAKLLRRA